MRFLWMAIVLVLMAGCVFADDIVTMPTANQLKQGEVDTAVYHISLDFPTPAPQSVEYQTLYVGLTDWLEFDVHRSDVDNDKDATVLVAQVKLLSENKTLPDVVVGCRNLGGTATTNNPAVKELSKDRSYYLCMAKTFFVNPLQPGPPLFRLHLGYGSEDWTLLGDKRHDGLFGGIQMLFAPDWGAVLLNDGESVITGITFMPKNTGLTLKGGSYGEHLWVGMAFRKQF